MSYHCHVEIMQVAMIGMRALMLIKYNSHPGGVNGTQVNINLTLRAVLVCQHLGMPQGWWNGCGMMRLHSDYVYACLSVFILNSQGEKLKKCSKCSKKEKGKLTCQKIFTVFCHMVRWLKHAGHDQGHHAFVFRQKRASSHMNVLTYLCKKTLKLTSKGCWWFETYNIHKNSHCFILWY